MKISSLRRAGRLVFCQAAFFALAGVASATTYTVNTTSDFPITTVNPATGAINSGPNSGAITLRSAVIGANENGAGPHIINVPAGTYNLTQPNPDTPGTTATTSFYDIEAGSHLSTITINGTGGTPIIHQTVAGNDVITTGFQSNYAPAIVNLTLNNLEITGGTFTAIFTGADDGTHRSSTTITSCNIHNNTTSDASFGQGGAIFNQTGILSISNTVFANNSATNSSVGQGGAIFYNLPNGSGQGSTGSFSVTNCTFSSNTSGIHSGFPAGGAIFLSVVSPDSLGGAINISGCTFSGNQANAGGDGGAIAVSDSTTRTFNITQNAFLSNQVTNSAGHGGAIHVQGGTVNINYNRFIGNSSATAANGNTISHVSGNSDPVNANDNWWGVNSGPGANDVKGGSSGGPVTLTTWLQLRNIASPSTVYTNQSPMSSTFTADLFGRNTGGSISGTNLIGLPPFPVPPGTIFSNPQRGMLSGASTQFIGGQASATFTATGPGGIGGVDATADNQTVTGAITVDQPPSITSANSATFKVGMMSTFMVAASGYPAPSFSESGALPTGVTFTNSGVLSGTPATGTGGVYPIIVTATNGVSPAAMQSFTLTVNEAPSITSADHATFTVGTSGSFTVTTGHRYPTSETISKSGMLPAGVTLVDNNDGTATLSGTPAGGTGGVYSFTITASNGVSPDATQSFTLTVNEAPSFTSASSTTFTVGTAGSFQLMATGYPTSFTFTNVGSALPSGVTLSPSGLLSGTPAVGTAGVYHLTFQASNGIAPDAMQSFTLTVNEAPAITSADHTTFTVGVNSSFTVTTMGYPAPGLTQGGNPLPANVTFTDDGNGTGTLSGTPASGTDGVYHLTFTANNGVNPNAVQNFTLTVNPHVAPIVTNTSDSGPGSLRQALLDAQSGDTITFNIPTSDPGYSGGVWTITLTSGELAITQPMTISGPGANQLVVTRSSSAASFRIFHIEAGAPTLPARRKAGAVPQLTIAGTTLHGLTISGGVATGTFPASAGGGIFQDNVSDLLTIEECFITGNSAAYGGGLYATASSSITVTVNKSTLSSNTATAFGGAVYNTASSNLSVVNSTISGNSAGDGGALYNSGADAAAQFHSCTLSRNSGATATDTGGIADYQGSVSLGNTILHHGTGENLSNTGGGTISSQGYNLSDGNDGALLNATGDQVNTDPILGPLKNNGGTMPTHAPLSNSPAIDRGKDLSGSGEDQRSATRPVTYDASIVIPAGGDRSDIGAIELAPGVQPSTAVSRKTHGTAGTFDIPLALTGAVDTECRDGGANSDFQIVISFATPITYSDVQIISGTGTIASVLPSSAQPNGASGSTQLTINLTGVADAQRLTLAITGASDGSHNGDVGLRIGFLLGDTNDDANVTSADVSQTKMNSGATANGTNFRTDVTANGPINVSDISLVKTQSGKQLPSESNPPSQSAP